MKYVVIGHTEMFLFLRHIDHRKFADKNGGANKVTSAGFVDNTPEGLRCTGDSHSLGIGSKEFDNSMLQVALKI